MRAVCLMVEFAWTLFSRLDTLVCWVYRSRGMNWY